VVETEVEVAAMDSERREKWEILSMRVACTGVEVLRSRRLEYPPQPEVFYVMWNSRSAIGFKLGDVVRRVQ
jgi:hypothetical protein